MNKQQYQKWLQSRGLSRQQVKDRKAALGPAIQIPEYTIKSKYKLSNAIPCNGTKSVDVSKANFANANYALVPAYNKGPIMVVTKDQLQQGAGRKQ